RGVDFSRARLADADLTGANLQSGKLIATDLSQALVNLVHAASADFTSARLSHSQARGVKWEKVVLKNTDLRGADMRGGVFNDADFSGANLAGANGSTSQFVNAALRNADLTSLDLGNSNLQGAKFAGAKLDGCKLKGTQTDANSEFDPKTLLVWKLNN